MHPNRIVVWIMIVAVAAGAMPAWAADQTTWGGIKRLYMEEPSLELGPGVSTFAAEQAIERVAATGAAFEGRLQIVLAGTSVEGNLLALVGRRAARSVEIHYVTESGRYVDGAVIDLAVGTARDAATGAVIFQDPRLCDLDPNGLGDVLIGAARRLGQLLCARITTAVIEKAVSKLLGGADSSLGIVVALLISALVAEMCAWLATLHVEQAPDTDNQAIGGAVCPVR